MRLLKHILLALAIAFPAFADTNVNTKTLQESLDSIDNWLGALAASAGATNVSFLPGTNIVGATYDETNEQWLLFAETNSLLFSVSDDGVSWSIELVNTELNPTSAPVFKPQIRHPNYALNSAFENLVSRQELDNLLEFLNFNTYERYTFSDLFLYGSSNAPPNNNQAFSNAGFTYTIPSDLVAPTGSIFRVHLWGSGGASSVRGGAGGYTYGDLIVVDPTNFVSTNAYNVTNGMVFCVHVGPPGQSLSPSQSEAGVNAGRAAVWRFDTNLPFSSFTNELLVAGGGGGGGLSFYSVYTFLGGSGGGLLGGSAIEINNPNNSPLHIPATGGSQVAGGSAGVYDNIFGPAVNSTNGLPGVRLWGGNSRKLSGNYSSAAYFGGAGGDGYYGGGSGETAANESDGFVIGAGAAGSGFVSTNWNNKTVLGKTLKAETFTSPEDDYNVPRGTVNLAYANNAGYPATSGMVVFELIK